MGAMGAQATNTAQGLEYFRTFSTFKPTEFDDALSGIKGYATEQGLSAEELELVTGIAFKQTLGAARVRKLVKCLIPATNIPDTALLNVLRWLFRSHNTLSVLTMKPMLQWLIIVADFKIGNIDVINLYYDLFYMLLLKENLVLLSSRLIYILTKPEDVSRWYVKQVLRVHETNNKPKCTAVLLYLFKMYSPENVPEQIPAYSVQSVFRSFSNTEGFERAQARLNVLHAQPEKTSEEIVWYDYDKIRSYRRKNSEQLLPEVEYYDADRKTSAAECNLLSITNKGHLHKYLVASKPPCHTMSLLNNSAGYHVLIFADKPVKERLCIQLYYTLYDAFIQRNPNVSESEKEYFMKKISLFHMHVQQSVPVISKFLAEYISRWDGMEHKDRIYQLISWISFQNYAELHSCILEFLYMIYVSSPSESKCDILNCLGDLVVNIISRSQSDEPKVFIDVKTEWDFDSVLTDLYEFIRHLCTMGLYLDKCNSIIMHGVTRLHEKILMVESIYKLQKWSTMDYLAYGALFAKDPVSISRFCGLATSFPRSIDSNITSSFLDCLWNNQASTILFKNNSEMKKKFENELNNFDISMNIKNHFAFACYNYAKIQSSSDQNLEDFLPNCKRFYNNVIRFIAANFLANKKKR